MAALHDLHWDFLFSRMICKQHIVLNHVFFRHESNLEPVTCPSALAFLRYFVHSNILVTDYKTGWIMIIPRVARIQISCCEHFLQVFNLNFVHLTLYPLLLNMRNSTLVHYTMGTWRVLSTFHSDSQVFYTVSVSSPVPTLLPQALNKVRINRN